FRIENGTVSQHCRAGGGQTYTAALTHSGGIVEQGSHAVQHGDVDGHRGRGSLDGAGDGEGTHLVDERIVIIVPHHVLGGSGAVAVGDYHSSGQLGLVAQLHIVVAGDLIADDAVLHLAGIGGRLGFDRHGTGGETVGLGG